MASGSSLEAALQVLEDNSISYLMRSENYRNVENVISNGEPVSPQHTKQLLQVFAHDLKQDTKFAVTILKLLNIVLKKLKLGEYDFYPELSTTATAIMSILSKMAPLHKVQSLQTLCLEILLSYPDRLYLDLGTKHTADLVNLMDQYLSNTNVDSEIKVMMMNILVRVLESLAEGEKQVFVEKGLSVWFSRLVPLIFSGLPLKEKALNITETIISDIIRIDYSDHPQWNILFKNISSVNKYPETLKTMLADGDSLWHRAWCCIVKLLGSKLHKSAPLINSLLSVLENAFKMNMVDRCRAFQCWKVLIENFSLNMDQFFTSRRIKLLLIPLTVNNAKEENSASAKFETWWFLLELLQPKIEYYVDSIVVPFLQFCFGQAKPPKDKQKPVIVPGLAFSKVRNLAIQAIVEVVGHSDCSGCISSDINKLPAPILSPKTLVTHSEIWMHAIKEATILMSETKHDQTEQNIKCLYKCLLKYMSAIDDKAKQATVYLQFVKMISDLVLKSQQNSSLANIFFNMITPSILNEKSELLELDNKHKSGSDITLQHIFKLLLCPAFEQFTSPCTDTSVKKLKPLTDLGLQADGFVKWLLQELQTGEHSITWWMSLTQSIVDTDFCVNEDIAKDILIWPITKLESINNVRFAAQSWSKMYTYINQSLPKDSLLHLDVLNILMLHYKNTYVHNAFTIHILPLTITCVLDNNSNKVDSLEKELEVLSDLSAMIDELCNDDYKIILETTIGCLSSCLHALAQKCNADATKQTLLAIVNNVLKYLLACQTINQTDTEKLIQKILKPAKVLFPNGFDSTTGLLIEESLSKCGQAKILNIKKIFHEWQNSKSDVKAITNEMTEDLNIKDKESKTPKSKTPSKVKVTGKIVKKVVDGNEEFVIVKSNWKFNPNKLTEHQKEVLKKKREDIPALYQDLSQSQDEVKIKSWKMPGYKSDSQDVSTSTTISLDKNDANNSVSNILKDIPNCEVCPNVMKAIMNEDNKSNDKIQSPKSISETLKENSDLKVTIPTTPKVLQKITPSKSRMSLKDKVNKSVQSLLGNVIHSDITSPMNKTLNSQIQYTPVTTNDRSVSTTLSAPPKLDSERPSRTKRKPKKLEEDFEILDIIKKKRHSIENEVKSCDKPMKLKEKDYLQTSQESEKVNVIAESGNVKELINNTINLEEKKKCSGTAIEEIITIHDESNPLPEPTVVEKTQATNNPITEIVTISHSPEQEQITSDIIITEKCTPTSKTNQNPEDKLIAQDTEMEQIISTNPSENTPKYIPKPKSKQDSEAKLLSTKKKNRLEVLLAIDTVEGHPLLTSKEEVRSTRKSRANELQTKRTNVDKTRISLGDTPKVKDSKKIKVKTPVSDKSDTIIDTTSDSQNPYASGNTSNNNTSLVNEAKPLQTSSHVFDSVELPLSVDFIESSQDSPVSSITIKSSRRSSNKHSDKKLQNTKNKGSDSSSTSECDSEQGSIENIPNAAKKLEELLIDSSSVDGTLVENTNDKIHGDSTMHDYPNLITNDSVGDETIATMDTQPLENCIITETVIDKEEGKTIYEINTRLSEIDHVNIAIQDTNKIKNLTDEEIAEMDTEPFVPTAHVPSRENAYSDDIIVIDDNSCDTTVGPPINVADSEKAQQLPPSEIGTSELVECESPEHTEINTLCDNSGNTDKSTNNAPRSPFEDNKERDHEFLNNTYDISPIKVSSPHARGSSPSASDDNSNDFVVITLTSPVKGDDEPLNKCESPEIFTNDKVSPDKKDESPTRTNTTGATGSPNSSLSLKKNRAQMRPSGRGAQMLGLCNPSTFYRNTDKVDESSETNGTPVVTPAAKRNLRVAYANCADNESHPSESINHVENFLNLTKELPPVTSSPAGPILKRKLADIADETTMTPVCKRKRVSFHDPPVSTTVSVQKYIEDTCIKSPQQHKNKDKKSRPMTSRKKLENVYADSIVQAMDTSVDNNDDAIETTTTQDTQTNSLADTPFAVIVARDELTNSDPIYPELTDCTHPIAHIISELTTDSMKDMFLKDLRDIATIGDLAKLTELEVNRMSIKTPKVETARKVLASYACRAKDKPTPKAIEVSHMEIQTEFEEEFLWETLKDRTSREVIESCLEKKDDFIEEFSSMVSREVKRKMAEDLPTSVISDILNDRFQRSDSEESEQVLTTWVRDNPQKFLDKTFSELGAEQFSERLGLDNMQKYILEKLSFVELAKFFTILMQKKLPSD